MNVRATLPHWDSLIHEATPYPEFEDCYSVSFTPLCPVILNEVVYRSFASFSMGWADFLFRLRNILVKPFGLKRSEKRPVFDYSKAIMKGSYVAFFKVVNITNDEVLLYADDSHLEAWFAISVNHNKSEVTINAATTVNTRNRFGRLYLFAVAPFHKFIVKNMMKKLTQHYTTSKEN